MGRHKQNENRTGQFTKWIRSETKLAAWKALTPNGQAAYMYLRVRCFAETAAKKRNVKNNNGEVKMSPRMLVAEMGVSDKTARAALADLQAKGWIVCVKVGHLGILGNGIAPEWRLTMMPTVGAVESCEPKDWKEGADYEILAYPNFKPEPRKSRVENFKKSKIPSPNRKRYPLQIGGDLLK